MAATINGGSVLNEVPDLLFDQKFNWKKVNECINPILEDNGTNRHLND